VGVFEVNKILNYKTIHKICKKIKNVKIKMGWGRGRLKKGKVANQYTTH
jgi:hypothetical protein